MCQTCHVTRLAHRKSVLPAKLKYWIKYWIRLTQTTCWLLPNAKQIRIAHQTVSTNTVLLFLLSLFFPYRLLGSSLHVCHIGSQPLQQKPISDCALPKHKCCHPKSGANRPRNDHRTDRGGSYFFDLICVEYVLRFISHWVLFYSNHAWLTLGQTFWQRFSERFSERFSHSRILAWCVTIVYSICFVYMCTLCTFVLRLICVPVLRFRFRYSMCRTCVTIVEQTSPGHI